MLRQLLAALLFALVNAIGFLHILAISLMNSWSGILTPISSVAGFRSGFNSGFLLNTRVTGPGRRSSSTSDDTVTSHHLKTTNQ